jgi:spermidine synthase
MLRRHAVLYRFYSATSTLLAVLLAVLIPPVSLAVGPGPGDVPVRQVGAGTGGGWPRILYQHRSEFNQIFVRQQADGTRELLFESDNVIQSACDPRRPDELVLDYTRTTMAGLAVVPDPKRILIVGLGGGSMPKFLRHYYPQAVIDVAELDPAVVDVARQFFAFAEDPRLKVHVGDGRAFIEKSTDQYDLIFLDAYGPDNIPYALATREFLEAVRARLSDGGVVVANLFGPEHNRLYASMLRTYQAVFPEIAIIRSHDRFNRIVLAPLKPAKWTGMTLAVQAAAIQRRLKLSFDLTGIINNGYEPVPRDVATARVLLDADMIAR